MYKYISVIGRSSITLYICVTRRINGRAGTLDLSTRIYIRDGEGTFGPIDKVYRPITNTAH